MSAESTRPRRIADAYRHGHEQPLAGYVGALAAFAGTTAAAVVAARAEKRRLPRRFPAADLVWGGLAVHKFARLMAKDAVTSPIRAPFARFEEAAGSSEVNEKVRDDEGQARHAVGELITCPFCLAPWIATGYVSGLVVRPRAARLWAATFAVVGISDALQQAYARLRAD